MLTLASFFTGSGGTGWMSLGGIVSTIAIAIWSAAGRVKTGEWGVFIRFEKVVYKKGMPKLAPPGLRPLIPWLWAVRTLSVMDRSSDLTALVVDRITAVP